MVHLIESLPAASTTGDPGPVDAARRLIRLWRLEQDYLPTQRSRLTPLFDRGDLRVVRGPTYHLHDTATALRDLDERRATGKIILATR